MIPEMPNKTLPPKLSPPTLRSIGSYWAEQFGISPDTLFQEPLSLVTHGPGWEGYHGVQALFDVTTGHAIVSMPEGAQAVLHPLLEPLVTSPLACTPASLAEALRSVASKVIGPAILQYTGALVTPEPSSRPTPPSSPARVIHSEGDAALVTSLQSAVTSLEWEHGGSDSESCHHQWGVIVGETLTALATYEVWGGTIAHISIVTHPAYRGQGHGRAAVALATQQALAQNLVPQYRTLASNTPSLAIAQRLGFVPFATSLAVRLTPLPPSL